MLKILIIEDEVKLHEVIEAYLKREEFEVFFAIDGEEGIEIYDEIKPDLLVLDLMLPKLSGEEVCKYVRSVSDTPIIMLTAKSAEDDRINGFFIGADDYLVKPFSPKELVMRIKAILKRTYKMNMVDEVMTFNNGELVVNLIAHYVKLRGRDVELTPSEFSLLEYFIKNPRNILSRNQIIENVFGYDFPGNDRTIDAHIKNLRKKIEVDSKHPAYILTEFGFGYKFGGEKDD
jgi:two-component system OmpR family response regulator